MKQINYATFAGGCFWCMIEPFEEMDGIISVKSGYMGGTRVNPTYEEVCTHETGHLEVVQIKYDETRMTYEKLLQLYWQQIDPTDSGGQFYDRGDSYRTAIFYHDEIQKKKALESKTELEASKRFNKPIVTEIREATAFYEAEAIHQNYHQTHKLRYNAYREASGRDQFIQTHWENETHDLSPMQYHVTKENGTEPPFQNEYWNNEAEGIYVDILSGEALFSSTDQYDAGCGWPSFTRPINENELINLEDTSHGMKRIEVRSKTADSHLGHVFPDGPEETGGIRYCINSAAMRFIPKNELQNTKYEKYLVLFNNK